MKLVVHLADFGWPVEADELAHPPRVLLPGRLIEAPLGAHLREDRRVGARAGVAVAKVRMGAAQTASGSAGNVRLRPQLLADVRMARETIHCESCKRILYWDERTVRL